MTSKKPTDLTFPSVESQSKTPFTLSVACASKRTRGDAMDGAGFEEREGRSAAADGPSTPALRAYAQAERWWGY